MWATPKITLSVDLIGDHEATIKLMYVTSVFGDTSAIYTHNQWEIRKGPQFKVNVVRGIIILPVRPNKVKDQVTLHFSTDGIRKELLRNLSEALLQWSGDMFFKSVSYFEEEPFLRFNRELWIIY